MIRRRWPWLMLLVIILATSGFLVWAGTPARPMPEALAAMAPGQDSTVSFSVPASSWLVFEPAGSRAASGVGLIIYPGGRVDARAYAPLAHSLARSGHLIVIVKMPLNLAVFGANRATGVIAAYPEVESWAIGGHSLGGAVAARFAYRNPGAVQGLVLWAAYPASNDDLSTSDLTIASIYGTLDGLATSAKIDASRPLLPASTRWVPIEGGNHAQFGWYGSQSGDNPAAIGRSEQQAQIIGATLALLAALAPR